MKREEDALQRTCCDWLRILQNQGKLMYFAIPNGGKRSKIEAAIMKGLGVIAGASDLAIILPPYGRLGLIELKAPGKKPRDNQNEFGAYAIHHGAHWAWCDNIERFMALVNNWLEEEAHRKFLD